MQTMVTNQRLRVLKIVKQFYNKHKFNYDSINFPIANCIILLNLIEFNSLENFN